MSVGHLMFSDYLHHTSACLMNTCTSCFSKGNLCTVFTQVKLCSSHSPDTPVLTCMSHSASLTVINQWSKGNDGSADCCLAVVLNCINLYLKKNLWDMCDVGLVLGGLKALPLFQSRDHCTNTDLKPRQSQTLSSACHAYRTQYGRTPSHTWSRTKVKAVKRRVDVQHHSGKRTHDSIRWLARWRRGWTWAARQVWMKVWTESVNDHIFSYWHVCQVCRDSTHTTTFIPKRS